MSDCKYRRALVRLRNAVSDLSPEALDELNAIDEGASWEAYRVLTLEAKECDATLRAEVARLTAENEKLKSAALEIIAKEAISRGMYESAISRLEQQLAERTQQLESLTRHHQKREAQYEQWLAERTQQLAAAKKLLLECRVVVQVYRDFVHNHGGDASKPNGMLNRIDAWTMQTTGEG